MNFFKDLPGEVVKYYRPILLEAERRIRQDERSKINPEEDPDRINIVHKPGRRISSAAYVYGELTAQQKAKVTIPAWYPTDFSRNLTAAIARSALVPDTRVTNITWSKALSEWFRRDLGFPAYGSLFSAMDALARDNGAGAERLSGIISHYERLKSIGKFYHSKQEYLQVATLFAALYGSTGSSDYKSRFPNNLVCYRLLTRVKDVGPEYIYKLFHRSIFTRTGVTKEEQAAINFMRELRESKDYRSWQGKPMANLQNMSAYPFTCDKLDKLIIKAAKSFE